MVSSAFVAAGGAVGLTLRSDFGLDRLSSPRHEVGKVRPRPQLCRMSAAEDEAPSKNDFKGFGKPPDTTKRAPSKSQVERERAANAYDAMQKVGMPEYNVFVRITGAEKDWYPVGSLAVERSSRIDAQIYNTEDKLVQGALRLFPKLKDQEDNLEYGYQLKEFPDEQIRVAVKPTGGMSNPLFNWFDNILNPLNTKNLKNK